MSTVLEAPPSGGNETPSSPASTPTPQASPAAAAPAPTPATVTPGQPAATTPPPATPDYSWMDNYGGADNVKSRLGLYDAYAGEDQAAFLDALYGLSETRYDKLHEAFVNEHPDITVSRLLANEAGKQQLFKELGFSQEDYDGYAQYLAAKAQNIAADSPEAQQIADLQAQLSQFQSAEEQAENARIEQAAQGRVAEYTQARMTPIARAVEALNLPATREGNVQKAMITGAAQTLFRSDPNLMKLHEQAAAFYHKNEGQFAVGLNSQIDRATEAIAREVVQQFADNQQIRAENEQLRAQLGMGRREPAINGAAGAPANTPAAPPQQKVAQSPFGGPLSYDNMKGELEQMLAQKFAR